MLATIAQNLQEHENATRIKKLMLCALRGKWENNPKVLAQHSMETLLQELIASNSTHKHLIRALYSIVTSLNRKAVYYPLAKTIISQSAPLYQKGTTASSTTKQKTALISPPSIPLTFEETLQELENSPKLLRIKKLIYCACEGTWENNSELISRLALKDLVVRLMELNPTKEKISYTLHEIVRSLNNQGEYFIVANLILSHLIKFYSIPDDATQITSSRPEYTFAEQDDGEATVYLYKEKTQVENPPRKEREYNLFDLRLEVMKYTSPLRAKIIIFSVLQHQFDFSEKHWSLLKSHPLDELLSRLYRRFSSLAELETCLMKTAESLSQLDGNTKAAGAILYALKPLYE